MGEIYKITSTTSKKAYIGKTIKPAEIRFKEHINNAIRGSSSHFYNALRKYGSDDFKLEILEKDVNIEILGDKEKYWINFYNTYYGEGYNMSEGGGNGHRPHSDETKKKISDAWTDERKIKQSIGMSGENNHMYGYNWSEEQLFLKSTKMRGDKNPMFGLKGELNPNFGKEKPNSFFEKIKKTWTADKRKEQSKKMSGENNPNFGKTTSDETKKKISESNKNCEKFTCEYCQKEMNKGNYNRWHGKNCKAKKVS